MQQTELRIVLRLRSAAAPEAQRRAVFDELRLMLKSFRLVPFVTNGEHEEIFIVSILEAPD
jgi:hypothetical protein